MPWKAILPAHGIGRLSWLGLAIKGWIANRERSRLSGSARQFHGDRALSLYQVAGLAPMIPLDDQLRPTWLFGKTVHEGCDRAGYYEQGDFAEAMGRPSVS